MGFEKWPTQSEQAKTGETPNKATAKSIIEKQGKEAYFLSSNREYTGLLQALKWLGYKAIKKRDKATGRFFVDIRALDKEELRALQTQKDRVTALGKAQKGKMRNTV
ncbi:MAG: hypothetical protein ABSF00_04205 [Candidatus Bathyarchaeia archaeon]|jgi:catechol-2,3-dioxygenase